MRAPSPPTLIQTNWLLLKHLERVVASVIVWGQAEDN